MALQSQLFSGESKLEAAATFDPAHIVPGARGPHVGKIQLALNLLDAAGIAQDDAYGPATATAVRTFKRKRRILNFRGQLDDIVGKKTMAALDEEVLARERLGGGGGMLNFKFGLIEHTLIYFSGNADAKNLGGVRLLGHHGEEVLEDMEAMDVLPDWSEAIGYGGSANFQLGVARAKLDIHNRDPRGLLIIYGFSAGGVNSLDLCRSLSADNTRDAIKVDLLVTVDVHIPNRPFDRTVPPNVVFTRNYFQTSTGLFSSARGGVASGGSAAGEINNINCDHLPFEDVTTIKTRHSQMYGLTRHMAIRDMRASIRTAQLKRQEEDR